ncbi:MAG: phage terminase large subunit family protein [Deltaproteobacteria bacterium]|nr:phage terminase large subunit family protein [Deltaproteobacteria bacterium]
MQASALTPQHSGLFPRAIPYPAELPPHRRELLAGMPVSFSVPRPIKICLRSPEKIRVSEWAVKHRIVTEIDAFPGPWRNDLVPHAAKIMDTIGNPSVREVWMCMVERSAKTQILMNAAMSSLDQGSRSGNIFWLMPTEKDARDALGERIIPALRSCTRTARLLSDKADDTSRGVIRFRHGASLRPAWSNSPSSMASYFGRLNIADECDKFAERTSEGTDPITLFKKRSRDDRRGSKYLFASTPGGRYIYAGTMACQQVWVYQPRCPDCGEYVLMDYEHLVVPEAATAENIAGFELFYACNACGAQWDEDRRKQAYLSGHWVATKGVDLARPETVGFHFPAFPCPTVSMQEIAGAWLKAKDGSVADKIAWANGYEAINYEAEHQDRKEDHILRLVDPAMPRGVVPRDPCCLVLLVDTQRVGFYYQVWAYGWGRDMETWRVDHGFVEHFDHLKDIAAKTWLDADGKEYRASAGFIDSGGGTDPHQPKHSRTAEVYEFCRMHPFFRPLKGRRDMAQPWNTTRLDYYPSRQGKKIPIPGGLTLYTINVTMAKNELAAKLQIEPSDPGAFHLHAEVGSDYAQQMCAEYQDERGYWICPRNKPNHHWDISVYGMAGAEILRIRDRRPEGVAGPKRKVYSKGVQQ